ncbi:MAG: YbaK/EbsC family protein [Candidatus Brocadiia bacterium]|jgi:Ala-tRNA(Pro) deacylase
MDVESYLKDKGVQYEVIPHEQAFTAQEVAAAEHVTGHKFAKTVIAKSGDNAYMLVLPASHHVDFEKASDLVGEELEMASEEEMKKIFPDCEIGAEPPFGSEYGLPTYVDSSLTQVDDVVFRAGTHDLTIRMRYDDYAELEDPAVGDIIIEE